MKAEARRTLGKEAAGHARDALVVLGGAVPGVAGGAG
jgi:hypothetical protein